MLVEILGSPEMEPVSVSYEQHRMAEGLGFCRLSIPSISELVANKQCTDAVCKEQEHFILVTGARGTLGKWLQCTVNQRI